MTTKIHDECFTTYKKFGTISISYIQRKYQFSFKVSEKMVREILQKDGIDEQQHRSNVRKIFGKTRINKRSITGASRNKNALEMRA